MQKLSFIIVSMFILNAAWMWADDTKSSAIEVHKRFRIEREPMRYAIETKSEQWNPKQTAIIVCDMWDSHHCLNAVRRVNELAPQMNRVLEAARARGVLIIHAPSSCMDAYEGRLGRQLAKEAPTAKNLPSEIGIWCKNIPAEASGVYPIDQLEGGEDDDPIEHQAWVEKLNAQGRNPKAPWKSQIAAIQIQDSDPISDSGVEIWNVLEDRRIQNVILLGVHTNMCVLGRPFGLRQMAKNGKNVVLMRDMTDTMYNPAKAPYVNHFGGTELIVEHIEKYVCPTITSVDFVGGQPFRFQHDLRNIAMIIGDDEYQTEVTLPEFSKTDLESLGFQIQFVYADSTDKNRFPGIEEAVERADVLVISARRRTPPKEQLAAVRRHLANGKPIVGIRTASHAFCLRNDKDNLEAIGKGLDAWSSFDPEILGGNYKGHHGAGPKTNLTVGEGNTAHPILRGVDLGQLIGNGSLYKVSPLAKSANPLLMGTIPDQQAEPVAWTNQIGEGQARVFYTSLGHPDDFKNPHFRKLLLNGLLWTIAPDYSRTSDSSLR